MMDQSPSSLESPASLAAFSPSTTQPIPKKSQQIKTDKPRPHICSICTRAFARLEHLKRHERSHTNEKPFQCAACGRCFARRDLVLRHQQKLHASLPNILRRGSAKDMDTNEHIIILSNNTDANVPLPDGEGLPYLTQESPLSPKNDKSTPQFRTSLFGYGNVIPSPIPTTNSSLTTPPNVAKNDLPKAVQQPSPQTGDSPPTKISPKKEPSEPVIPENLSLKLQLSVPSKVHPLQAHHLQLQFRHASFSAASAISYTNLKDAIAIQQRNTLDGPSEVEFATPQLSVTDLGTRALPSGLDLHSLAMDWGNIDGLDLSTLAVPSALQSAQIEKRPRNSYFDPMVTHQYTNPEHPHHIKGTTPKEYGMNTPHDIASVQQILQMGADGSAGLDSSSGPAFNLNSAISDLKKREPSVHENGSSKRVKMELDDDWLQDILKTPFDANVPNASHEIGFADSSFTDLTKANDEISSLFKSRQINLVKQMSFLFDKNGENLLGNNNSSANLTKRADPDINVAFTIGDAPPSYISEELRNKIILVSNLSNLQFPPLDDLNAYMMLYEKEFNKFFPFIHLPSLKNPMVDNFENIPLLLSMAAIGALYSYHDSNTLLLFNLSKFQIHSFFEKEITMDNLQFKKVPLMAHQCLVLHIFISMFLNEPNMLDVTSRQMKSMVGLIRSTNFNKPLEQFLIPPKSIAGERDPVVIQHNFDYFIMAQSRIRTIYVLYMLQVFRSSLVGSPIQLPGSSIESGTHCANENLWLCEDSRKWFNELSNKSTPLVELSNNESMSSLIGDLHNYYHSDSKISHGVLLSLLMYIHEQIEKECLNLGVACSAIAWRLRARPKLENLVKSWEAAFIRNGGFLVVNAHNNHMLNANNQVKVILPLLSFAKIRLSINITPILSKILYKDWDGMCELVGKLEHDDGLKESSQHALDILNLWVHNISVINDPGLTSLRTPVFFVTCLLVATLIISRCLAQMEKSPKLSDADRVFWMDCHDTLQKIEQILSPLEQSNFYSEFLKQSGTGNAASLEAFDMVRNLIESDSTNPLKVVSAVKECQLSTRALFLGIRALADAPVWPMAMGFAEALKILATSAT